jgi:PHD/YefM family antitoxin component YafN of YafNO toxin-antitoxin module
MSKVKEPEATYIVDRKGNKKAVVLPIETYDKLLEDLKRPLSSIFTKRRTENLMG